MGNNKEKLDGFYEGTFDDFCIQLIQYFVSGRYNNEVVDLLANIIAQAMELHLIIYQKTKGKIHILEFIHSSKQVHLKYSGDHYDSCPLIISDDVVLVIDNKSVSGSTKEDKQDEDQNSVVSEVHSEESSPEY